MSAPTCRTCYANTLTDHQRERFLLEPVTTPVFYCVVHDLSLERYIDWESIIQRPTIHSDRDLVLIKDVS